MHDGADPTLALAHRVEPVAKLIRGATIGRYVVLDALGEGGMGVVYRAYDPDLDRSLAIKLLKAQHGSATARAAATELMVREGRALAKLAHPNVLAVYDVGLWSDGIYIATEFVAGDTLRRWRMSPRTVKEVLVTMVKAGEGLAAAHRAGLIHRDFKPDNVIVASDGSVRVIDFGLASFTDEAEDGLLATSVDGASLGVSGALSLALEDAQLGSDREMVMGTPRYMAPEQRLLGAANARSDQYSFAVTILETLLGNTSSDPNLRLAAAERLGRLHGGVVSRRVRRALVRALDLDPAKRFPTVEALLEELRPRARTSLVVVLGAMAVAATTAFVAAEVRHGRAAGAPVCAVDALEGVWDGQHREELKRTFLGSRLPYAPATYAGVSRLLDGYAGALQRGFEDACAATRVRGVQSEELMDLRMACYSARREHVRASVELLTQGGDDVIERAPQVAAGLPSLEDCNDAVALRTPVRMPKSGPERLKADVVEAVLARARAHDFAGKYSDGLVAVQKGVALAKETGLPALEARAALTESNLLDHLERTKESRVRAIDGARLAERAHDDRLALEAFTHLVWLEGIFAHRFENAEHFVLLARGKLERAGMPALELAKLLHIEGALLYNESRFEDAKARLRESLQAFERAKTSPDSPQVGNVLLMLGNVASSMGASEEALESYERALGILERTYGATHPSTAAVLTNESDELVQLGRGDEAIKRNLRAIAIFEGTLGSRHAYTLTARSGLAQTYLSLGRVDDAIVWSSAIVADARNAFGARAREALTLAEPLAVLGNALHEKGDIAGARRALTEAIAINERSVGADHPDVATVLVALGRTEITQKAYAVAVPLLERAEKLLSANDGDPNDLAEARLVLACALLAQKPKDERGRTLLESAHHGIRGATRRAESLRREAEREMSKAR